MVVAPGKSAAAAAVRVGARVEAAMAAVGVAAAATAAVGVEAASAAVARGGAREVGGRRWP